MWQRRNSKIEKIQTEREKRQAVESLCVPGLRERQKDANRADRDGFRSRNRSRRDCSVQRSLC